MSKMHPSWNSYPYFYHTTDPDRTLAYPHYSDRTFAASGGACIYGDDKAQNDGGEYSDRLWQWEWDKAQAATDQCNAEGIPSNTARRWERWLSLYYGRPVTLTAIIAGARADNGYPWYFLKFRYVEAL